jgi:hypothetical protein
LYKVVTTRDLFLEKQKLPIDYIPVVSYTPNNEPEELYPR